MTHEFDPYYEWLGIPPKDQPPTLYRLLGIELFEANPNVIENAADRQMTHVRTFQGGKNAEASQKLLNELAGAKVKLLNPKQRAAYDAQLQAEMAARLAPAAPPMPGGASWGAAPPPVAAPMPGAYSPGAMPPGAPPPGTVPAGGYAPQPTPVAVAAAPAAPAFETGPQVSSMSRRLRRSAWQQPPVIGALVLLLAGAAAAGYWMFRGDDAGLDPVTNAPDVVASASGGNGDETPAADGGSAATDAGGASDSAGSLSGTPDDGRSAAGVPAGPSGSSSASNSAVNPSSIDSSGTNSATSNSAGTNPMAAAADRFLLGSQPPSPASRLPRAPGEIARIADYPGPRLALATSSDGRLLAAGGTSGYVSIYELPEFRRLVECQRSPIVVQQLAFSADKRQLFGLAPGRGAGSIARWNVDGGELAPWPENVEVGGHLALSVSSDGRWLGLSGVAGRAFLARLPDLESIADLPAQNAGSPRPDIAFSVDGRHAATVEPGPMIFIWDVSGDTPRHLAHAGTTAPTVRLLFLSTGRLVAADRVGRIAIYSGWDQPEPWNLEREFAAGGAAIRAWSATPDGRYLAVAAANDPIGIWNLRTGEIVHTLEGHTLPTTGLAFLPGGSLASSSIDGSVRIWNLPGVTTDIQLAVRGASIEAAPVAASGTSAVAGTGTSGTPSGGAAPNAGERRSAMLPTTVTEPQELAKVADHTGAVAGLAISPDGKRLATGGADGRVLIYDADTLLQTLSIRTPRSVNALAFSRDGQFVYTANPSEPEGKPVRRWKLADGELDAALSETLPDGCRALQVSRDGRWLGMSGDKGAAELYGLTDSLPRIELPGADPERTRVDIVFSPDGHFAATAEGNEVFVWDVQADQVRQVSRYDVGLEGVSQLLFTPHRRLIAGSSRNGTIRVWNDWDKTMWRLEHELTGHAGAISDLAVARDGRMLASAAAEDENPIVRLWDLRNGKEYLQLAGHDGGVLALEFLPDGRLASGGKDGTLRLWAAPSLPAEPQDYAVRSTSSAAMSPGRLSNDPQVNLLARRPTPSLEDRNTALAEVKRTYRADFANLKTPEARAGLASRLLARAQDVQDNPAEHFVLLDQARELSAAGHDLPLCEKTILALVESYDLQPAQVRSETFVALLRSTATLEVRRVYARQAMEVLGPLVREDDLGHARNLIEALADVTSRLRDNDLRKLAVSFRTEFRHIEKFKQEADAAKAVLEENPDDPDAHTAQGKYLAFVQDNWDLALEHLSKSNETGLRSAAQRERGNPQSLDLRTELADAWFNLAGAAAPERSFYQVHAQRIYVNALPDASGPALDRLRKRLEEMKDLYGTLAAQLSPTRELVVEALVDQSARLLLSPQGLRWRRAQFGQPPGIRRPDNSRMVLINGLPWELRFGSDGLTPVLEMMLVDTNWRGSKAGVRADVTAPVTQDRDYFLGRTDRSDHVEFEIIDGDVGAAHLVFRLRRSIR